MDVTVERFSSLNLADHLTATLRSMVPLSSLCEHFSKSTFVTLTKGKTVGIHHLAELSRNFPVSIHLSASLEYPPQVSQSLQSVASAPKHPELEGQHFSTIVSPRSNSRADFSDTAQQDTFTMLQTTLPFLPNVGEHAGRTAFTGAFGREAFFEIELTRDL